MTPERTIGVTGTAVEDTIVAADGSATRDMGGIYYAVRTLATLAPETDRIQPVLAVGVDAAGRVRSDFGALPRVSVEGLLPVEAVNNKVRIVYRSEGEREETLTGGVPPLSWGDLEPWVDRLDAWLWNFIGGHETDRATFGRVKAAFDGPIHLDVHSLCLEHRHGGPRRPRRPEGWETWLEGATWVQCNEREAGLLWSGEDRALNAEAEAALADRVRALGAEGLLVTRGASGATWHGVDGRSDAPAVGVDEAVDPTGCGDVTGAAWVALRFGRGFEPAAALEGAVAAAGRAAAVSGTRELSEALRSSPLPPRDREANIPFDGGDR